MKFNKLLISSFVLLFLIPLVSAFNLDVSCPGSTKVGQTIDCTIDLSESVTGSFGDQFIIHAPGFVAAEPFLDSELNGVQAFNANGLDELTLIVKFTADQPAGPVARFHLVADAIGNHQISLTDYVVAESSSSKTVKVRKASGGGKGGGKPKAGSAISEPEEGTGGFWDWFLGIFGL